MNFNKIGGGGDVLTETVNLYTDDGTLAGDRVVDLDSHELVFPNGNIGVGTTNPARMLQIGEPSSPGTILVEGDSEHHDGEDYNILWGRKKYPKITLTDRSYNGSTFSIWNLGNNLRFGTNTGTPATASWYIEAGDAGDVIFNGNIGIGARTPSAKLEVNGYTKLGTDAPAIKYKKLTGTTADSEGGAITIDHGLDSSKIISIRGVITYDGDNAVPFDSIRTNYGATVAKRANDIWVGETGSEILSKPFVMLIAYEE